MTENKFSQIPLYPKPYNLFYCAISQIFLSIVLSLSFNPISAQQLGHCNTYIKEPPYPVWYFPGDSSDTYLDRFGNLYSRDEITTAYHSNSRPINCTNTGYFNLILEGNFTPQEEMTICSVFNYLSTLVTPQVANPFVNIHIAKGVTQSISSLGEASPIWSTQECGIANSLVQEGLYGNASGVGLDHGFIKINSSIAWHTLDMDNTCPPNLVCSNRYDLYTVILHEAFHVLGFASNITVNGTGQGVSVVGNIFSRWDTYLYSEIQDRFLLREVAVNPECCDEHEFDNEHFPMPGTVNQVCASDIFFRVGGAGPIGISIAEVNSDALGSNVPNILSHLPESCNNSGEYVMNPGLNTGADRRTPNPDEIAILCALGYETAGSCATPPCTVSVGEDDPIIVELGVTLPPFPSTDLTANDVPQGGTFTFSPASPCNDYPPGMVNYDNPTGMFTITGTQLGVYTFCYTFTGCGGEQCDDGEVTIVVINPSTNFCCTDLPDCNINCLGDMEFFSSQEEMRLILTQSPNFLDAFLFGNFYNGPELTTNPIFSGGCGGPPSVVNIADGEQMLGLNTAIFNGAPVIEGVAFPLCEPIHDGESAIVRFLASTNSACIPLNLSARVEFCTETPVQNEVIYINPGVTSPPTFVTINSTFQSNPQFSQHSTPLIVNNSGVDWNFLVLSTTFDFASSTQISQTFFDNVEVVILKDLGQPIEITTSIVPVTPCLSGISTITYQVCNTSNQLSPELNFTIDIPTGLTHVPTPDIPSLGIVRPAGWLLPNECKTISLAVKVNNDQALIGQTLPVSLTVSAGDCYQNLIVTSNITPIENPLSITKTYTENPTTGELTFTLDVSNSHITPVGNVEVVDVLPSELDIVNANGFTVNGNVLTQVVTILALDHVQLTFTAIREDPCACADIQNCGIARIIGSGCGDVVDCIEIQGYSAAPDAAFTFTNDPADCHSVSFDASADNPCDTHAWDFGDGTTGIGATVLHNYANNGIYTVTHTVTNDCGTATSTGTVIIDCAAAFSCPCNTANSLYIDAGAGTKISDIPILNNLLNGDLNLDQYGNCIAIKGRLVVDKDFTFRDPSGNGESQMLMQPCSEIVVSAGKQLSISNLDISGCVAMWRGIRVQSYGKLSFTNNKVSDAQYAITAVPSPPNGPYTATEIQVRRNHFVRNHVGVLVVEKGVGLPLTGELLHSVFETNRFYSTGIANSMLPPCDGVSDYDDASGYAGVIAKNQQFAIGQSNRFYVLRNGVISENCRLQVQGSFFYNILGAPSFGPLFDGLEGIGINAKAGSMTVLGSYFNQMDYAMYADNNPVEVRYNNVQAARVALETRNAWGMIVENNDPVNFSNYGVTARDITPVPDGINGGKYRVGNNEFYSINGLSSLNDGWAVEFTNVDAQTLTESLIGDNYIEIGHQVGGVQISNVNGWGLHYNELRFGLQPIEASGVRLDNSSGNYLYDNIVNDGLYSGASPGLSTGFDINMSGDNTYCCNVSEGPATGFLFSGSCTGTDFRHNRMEVNSNSLVCTDATELSVQEDKGNHFDATAGPAAHGGTPFQVANSTFIIYDEDMDGFVNDVPYSPVSFAPANWFERSLIDAGECSGDGSCLPPDHYERPEKEIGDKDIETANGIYENTPRGQMLYWESRRSLYAKMRQNTELQGENAAVDAFFAAAATGSIGQHDAADEAVQNINRLPQSLITRLQNVQEILAANDIEVTGKLDELSGVGNWADSLLIYQEVGAIQQEVSAEAQELMGIMLEIRQLRRMNAAFSLPLINALPDTNVLESNRKTVYQVYLTEAAQGATHLTSAQFDLISDIAHQCPLEGGSGVFLARALYQ